MNSRQEQQREPCSAAQHDRHFGGRRTGNGISTLSPSGTGRCLLTSSGRRHGDDKTNERLNRSGQFYYAIIAASRRRELSGADVDTTPAWQLHVSDQSIYLTTSTNISMSSSSSSSSPWSIVNVIRLKLLPIFKKWVTDRLPFQQG